MREGDLLAQAKSFDLEALAEIYDRYSPGLYAYSVRLLGDARLAEDCVAEVFSRFLQTLKAGKGPQSYLQAYLYRIAHNWITDQFRRKPLPPLPLDAERILAAEHSPEAAVTRRTTQEQVRAALKRLTPDQRQVVMLKFFEGWENETIAISLQKPVGAVKSLQHRALDALRKMLVSSEDEVYEPLRSMD